ncbi:MAG: response regulator [Planctomycetota bacterium]
MYALVIDDSIAMRSIISRILKPAGFEILQGKHGGEGLERLAAHADDIGVVVVDWNMPEMDGLEFVKRVRADAAYAGLKIVMVTTEGEPARMAAALMAGVDEFLMKPFTEDALIGAMRLVGVTFPEACPA